MGASIRLAVLILLVERRIFEIKKHGLLTDKGDVKVDVET